MKNIFLLMFVSFFSLLFFSHSYAAVKTDANWEDIIIKAAYDNNTNTIGILGTVPASIKGSTTYTLGLDINGKNYRKELKYNIDNKFFEVTFQTPEKILKSSYTYSISVKNSQYYEQYKDSRVLYFNDGIQAAPSSNTSSISYSSSAQLAITKIIGDMNNRGYSLAQKISYIENVMLVLADYDSPIAWKQVLITEIIKGLRAQREIYKGTYSTTNTNPLGIYSSKQEEPKNINGIGNNPNYNSWRISY